MNNMKINKCLKKGQIGKGCNFIIIADCQLDITNSNLNYSERYRIVDFVPFGASPLNPLILSKILT